MADDPPNGSASGSSYDSDLLARLNALQPTSVSLDHSGPNFSIPSTQQTPDTLLSDRLRALRNGGSATKSSGSGRPPTEHIASAILSDASKQTVSAISSLETPIFEIDDQADKQLMRDALDFARTKSHDVLAGRSKGQPWQTSSRVTSPEDVIRRLRNDAEGGLLQSDGLLKSKSRRERPESAGSGSGSDKEELSVDEANTQGSAAEDEDRDLEDEAREAEEILAQLLDEANLEDRDEAEPEEPPQTETQTTKPPRLSSTNNEPLNLPSTPLTLRDPSDPLDPETLAFTNSITARMAALQRPTAPSTDFLGMPSAPTTRPVSSPCNSTSFKSAPDPPSSCVICYDNATVLCRGCEDNFGDAEEALYCARCWREGHLGADAGVEERRHEWIKFQRPK